MPTNEERRKIAARLRKAETSGDIGAAVGVRCGSRLCNGCAVETAKKLADLIDPKSERTCHVVSMDAAGNPPYRKGHMILNEMSDGCSVCGYPFDTANKGVPNYCPNCGARVIDE